MVDDQISAPAADSDREDLVSRLKSEIATLTATSAKATARADVLEDRERNRITAFQPDAQFLMKEWCKKECEEHHPGTSLLEDIAPLGEWSDEYPKKREVSTQGALAAFSYVASKGIKRLRDEASRNAEAATTLGNVMKENEELKENYAKVSRDLVESTKLGDERQQSLERLNAFIAEKGMVANAERFDFSKATSREEVPLPAEPHAAMGTATSLEAVKAEASKMAGGSSRANPLEKQSDLLSDLLGRSNGSGRVMASGTQHALLGHQGEADIGAMIRGK